MSKKTFILTVTFCLLIALPAVAQVEKKPVFETAAYRVTVESLEKKANNYKVMLVFENLLNKPVNINWISKSGFPYDAGPYLIDERGSKYFLQDQDSEKVVGFGALGGGTQIPSKIKLKSSFLFFGDGNGKSFSLKATEYSDFNVTKLITIDGLRVTFDEDKTLSSEALKLPTFNTESYRLVVESAVKRGDDTILTLVFESLADKSFILMWGSGNVDYTTGSFEGKEPYLIDENADRYYMRKQDMARLVGYGGGEPPELLPKTKLKTQLIFHVIGNGTVFTLGCKEVRPKQDRPIVIEGIKPQ